MSFNPVTMTPHLPSSLSPLRKLSEYDDWSKLAVHVAMDMVVVLEDISE